VLEDEQSMRNLLKRLLSSHYTVYFANSGAELSAEIEKNSVDLVLLDIHLPGEDGLTIAKFIRVRSPIPIILISGLSSPGIITQGLNIGGDDYVTKPFSPRELVLRIKKILERKKSKDADVQSLTMGELTIDVPRHLASWKGKKIDLTATEFKLLTLLVQRRGRVQSRDQLLRDVWEYDSMIDTRTVDTHMRRLREKLGPAAKFLDTVRGVGYRFVE